MTMSLDIKKMQQILNEIEIYLQRIPQFRKVSKVTSLKIIYILLGVVLLVFILGGFRVLSTLVGLIYPCWCSLKTIKSKQRDDDTSAIWLSYWVIYGIIITFESITNLLFWIPFYELIKTFFYLYLYLPQYKGALIFYHGLLEPVIIMTTNDGNTEALKVKQQFENASKATTFKESVKKISKTFETVSKAEMDRMKSYPQIQDLVKEQKSDSIKKAIQYTKKILSTPPTGKLGQDVNTTLHLMNEIFKSTGDECVFYDSRDGVKLAGGDSSYAMHEAFQKDKPCVLRLNTLDGLNGVSHNDMKDDTNKLIEMQSAIDNGIEHPTLIDVKNRLSLALGVARERINIIEVFAGSDCFKYTVSDWNPQEKQQMLQQDPTGRLSQQFPQFKELKIHPLLFRPAFDVANFDKRGDKSFVSASGKYQVGPSNMKKEYTQPTGWTRYGLTALGVYGDDKWLHPFGDEGNWWRAFHGTKNAGKYGVDPRDAMADIHNVHKENDKGWKPAKTAAYGPGVYCSPDPTFVEGGYAGSVSMNYVDASGITQRKNFKFMLQVAVKPGANTLTPQSTDTIWSVQKEENIRPYGILFKEV